MAGVVKERKIQTRARQRKQSANVGRARERERDGKIRKLLKVKRKERGRKWHSKSCRLRLLARADAVDVVIRYPLFQSQGAIDMQDIDGV